eukprot:scaffold263368_cov20-Prasinocladus_malaysianus.AAC.1
MSTRTSPYRTWNYRSTVRVQSYESSRETYGILRVDFRAKKMTTRVSTYNNIDMNEALLALQFQNLSPGVRTIAMEEKHSFRQ